MDAERFDAITRRAATVSRRPVLRGLLGSVLGGMGLLRAAHPAHADPKDFKNRGQSCTGPLDTTSCKSPCRACQLSQSNEYRCVYKCGTNQVCVISTNECE